ncbi:uncharacterized protein N7503_002478 [Penicillium pulvis]|uniref:uncharacterized protein n=1 Tax=Penicillium pulvis TaxID=1562058 RepID=UPI00254661A4|nr:uncharacterized protein N7503_002478 [Penicillium pulvis]KAJ5810260.1 hypothetical protein N7503_002478 [Penicillium pulvis]
MEEGAFLKYGERQIRGIFRMNWMLKPVTAVQCKVEQSTLEIADLPWYESGKDDISASTMNTLELFDLPFREDYHALIAWCYTSTVIFNNKSMFGGLVSDGLLVIEKMFRTDTGAHMSDVALAMYRNFYEINNLKQILFCNVVNTDTVDFFMEDLYTEKNGLDFAGLAGVQNWPYGTPEYLALLTTPICSVAVNIVLGAWPRGTHYVSNIQTCLGGRNGAGEMNIMVEIDEIPADLVKMPKLAKETKAALLEALDMDPNILDSESSKASEGSSSSEPLAKRKKADESKKRKVEEESEAGPAKKRATKALAEEESQEMDVDMDVDVEGGNDPIYKPGPAPKQAKGKGRGPRKPPVPKKGGKR